MGASKKLFEAGRAEEYKNVEHSEKFKEKIKYTWFSSEDAKKCVTGNLIYLTNQLIKFSKNGFKIDYQDRDRLIEMIDKLEPQHITRHHSEYMQLVLMSPIDNIRRVYEKYTKCSNFSLKKDYAQILEIEILKANK